MYEEVEIWASAHSTDASNLQPEKLGDTTVDYYAGTFVAGWGRYAFPHSATSIKVWSAPNKQESTLQLPAGFRVVELLALTKDFLWISAKDISATYNLPTTVIRYAAD